MVLLTLHKRVGITDSRADIIDRDAVFALHLLEAHSSSQTPEDNRDRQPGPTAKLAVVNVRGVVYWSVFRRPSYGRF
jgi:hypothetical protein